MRMGHVYGACVRLSGVRSFAIGLSHNRIRTGAAGAWLRESRLRRSHKLTRVPRGTICAPLLRQGGVAPQLGVVGLDPTAGLGACAPAPSSRRRGDRADIDLG